MNKKAIIAVLSALVLTVVASVTLILTVGQKANADTEILTVPVEYLRIQNGVLGNGNSRGAFTADGKTWIQDKQYRVEIPDTVTSISYGAFQSCSGLTSIEIPSSVTSIGSSAFKGCGRLTNITVGSPALLNHSALSSYKEQGYVHCRLTVTFDGGSSVDTETVDYESTVSAPSDPIREGYTFNGWLLNGQPYDFNTPVTDNLTLTAQWEAISYTVTFEVNGTIVDTKSVKYGSLVDAPAVQPVKGYPFVGWYTDESLTNEYDFDNSVTENMTLYAKWVQVAEEENNSTVTNANKNNIGLIAGIAGSVGAAIVTAVTVAIVLVLKKRK